VLVNMTAQYIKQTRDSRRSSSGKCRRPEDTLQENDTFVGSGLNPVFAHCDRRDEYHLQIGLK
jgi:hypothetical protein